MKLANRAAILTLSTTLPAAWASPARAEGAEVIPIFGLAERTGTDSTNLGWGPHLGISLGGRVNPRVSLHGQFQATYLRYAKLPAGYDGGGFLSMLTFAPFFHLMQPGEKVDVLVGPTLGLYGDYLRTTFADNAANGWSMGMHLGAALAGVYYLSPRTAIGPYLQYTRLFAQRECLDSGGDSTCNSDPHNGSRGLFSFGLSLSF